MVRKSAVVSVILLFVMVASVGYAQERRRDRFDLDKIFAQENVKPIGQYYEATVPDTLDLSERANLAVNALSSFLNKDRNYGPYGHAFFKVSLPYMTEKMYAPNMDAGVANWGKCSEARILMRTICGSTVNLDIEQKTLEGMIEHIYHEGCENQNARVIMALIRLYQLNPNPELKALIQSRVDRLHASAEYRGDYALYFEEGPETDSTEFGRFNYVNTMHDHGGPIQALCQWYKVNGDPNDLELAGKLVNYLAQPEFWEPEVEPAFFVGSEHAHYKGHHHSYLSALIGMLEYAQSANNARITEFVREGYEYGRNIGIARLGAFGEVCACGEMTVLAAMFAERGMTDYWEHVDQYMRNQLSEVQMIDRELMDKLIAQMPSVETVGRPDDRDVIDTRVDCVPGQDTTDRVVERNIGALVVDGGHPVKVPRKDFTWTICCTSNGFKGYYYAWNGIVQDQGDGNIQVNLLMNRASPWLDVDSYLPYEGKVVVKNKQAKNISIRLPKWVDKKAVVGQVNGKTISPFWNGQYRVFAGVGEKDVITLQFPVVESVETYTLKWKWDDRWFESNWASEGWEPGNTRYTLHLKGNTVVDISPRYKERLGYPMYLRDHLKDSNKAPMVKVKRFVHNPFAPNAD